MTSPRRGVIVWHRCYLAEMLIVLGVLWAVAGLAGLSAGIIRRRLTLQSLLSDLLIWVVPGSLVAPVGAIANAWVLRRWERENPPN